MIKMFLVEETADFVIYDYYVDKDIEKNRGSVKILKDNLAHQILKQDDSGWDNMQTHIKRVVIEGKNNGNYKKEAMVAWY